MSWWQKLTQKVRAVYGNAASMAEGGCDHGEIHLREGTAEFELFVARGELELGRDLKHGAGHLANLLTYDPTNPEWIELLEKYLAAAGPDPESLIPRGKELYAGNEAVRAYIRHKQGRLADAVQLLIDVVRAKPDTAYLEAWALDWLEPPGAVESLPEPLGLHLLGSVLNRFPEVRFSPLPALRNIRRWAALGERLAQAHPSDEPALLMMRAGLLRKAGRFDEAEALVRSALDRSPTWHTATALGLILRQKGDIEPAEDAFRQAVRLDPSDLGARLEAGDTFFEAEQWPAALAWYEDVLGRDAAHVWALPSALFCRWKLTDEQEHLDELLALAKQGNGRAQNLGYQTFWAAPPEPADATANLLRQVRQAVLDDPSKAPSGEIRLTLSSLEAPSNFLAFRLEMEALQRDVRPLLAVERVPSPDPRVPIGDVKYLLWRYDGIDATPAPPAPGRDVVQQVARLAAMPFDERAHWAKASRVAEALGPGRVGEILAVMVHPPPVPSGTTALAWLPRLHRAALEVAARVDEGWEGSARREALLSVLLGPRDWPTEAAIHVLGRLGREREVLAPDIHDAFQQLADHRPDHGYCPWEAPLYRAWLELPHLFPREREELQRTLREIEKRRQEP